MSGTIPTGDGREVRLLQEDWPRVHNRSRGRRPASIGTYSQGTLVPLRPRLDRADLPFARLRGQGTARGWARRAARGSSRSSRNGSRGRSSSLPSRSCSRRTFNIGADLGSMAEAFRLLVALPFVAVVIARAAVFLLLEVFLSYERYSAILQSLALSILPYLVELFRGRGRLVSVSISSLTRFNLPRRPPSASPGPPARSGPSCPPGHRRSRGPCSS